METIYLEQPHHLKKEELPPTVLALGFFDGVHIGHCKVINKAKEIARNKDCLFAVMTFYPHPSEVLATASEKKVVQYITPIEEKVDLLKQLEVDRLYIVRFDKPLSKLTPQQFVDDYLINLNVKHVVAGFDYTYGHLGKGTMETLPFHSRGEFGQTMVDKVEKEDEKISSTRIRKAILTGEVCSLVTLLGRYYSVKGKVVHGEKRGRKLGFPTANIEVIYPYMIPKIGVYAVTVELDGMTYGGVCNIGVKPTFTSEQEKSTIEVHIFDFNNTIYDEVVKVTFYDYIRSEKKFPSIDALIEQIEMDKKEAQQFLSEIWSQ